LRYAAGDVAYLLPAVEVLNERLDAVGRRAWAIDECEALRASIARYPCRYETTTGANSVFDWGGSVPLTPANEAARDVEMPSARSLPFAISKFGRLAISMNSEMLRMPPARSTDINATVPLRICIDLL